MRSAVTTLNGIMAMGAMLLVGAAPAYALGARASFSAGVVTVSGGHAARSASISWEGVVVTTANKGGSFAFTTTIVPVDCIGTVNDGTSSVDVRIDGCGDVTSGLPGTGQITSYASGDDGDIHAGGPLSYTDNGDGTVTDNRTGLTWEKKTDDNVATHYIWSGALDYVAALNAMNFAGHNDWRLPNIKELLSIVDYGRSNPAIDPIFGPTAGGSNRAAYWSSTSWATFYPEVNAWGVEFLEIYGTPSATIPFGKTSSLRVRAVRGGL
jgi:Protein of unknown function (DUF1566)